MYWSTLTINNSFVKKTSNKKLAIKSEKLANKTSNKIIAALKQNPSITMNALANVVGITVAGTRWQLETLKSQGVIQRVGSKKSGYWKIIEK